MKRYGLWIILFFFFIELTGPIAWAEEKTSSEGFDLLTDMLTIFPQQKKDTSQTGGYDVQYNRYSPSRYHLEISLENRQFWEVDNQISDASHYLMNHVNNFIWSILLNWNFTVIMMVENAFSLDVVDQFSDAVEKAVQQLAGFTGSGYGDAGIIGHFLTFTLILSGAYLAYKGIIQRKTTVALSDMFVCLLIFVLGMAFFANAGGIMRYLNEISKGLSQEAMGIGIAFQNRLSSDQEVAYSSDVSSLVVADKLYRMFVYEPYLMLQYGKTSHDPTLTKARIEKILDNKVGSSKRIQAIMDEKLGTPGIPPNPMVSTSGTFERLTLLMLLCVSHLLLGLLFLFIAGAMLVYQFMFVLSALFAPFAFLLALHPLWSSAATNWFKRFVGYQVTKLMTGLFFTMLLTLSQFLYQMNPPEKYGYVWTIAMQLILVAGVVWKRGELFNMLQEAMMGKGKKSQINVNMPLSYVTKYTNQLTHRIQKLNTRTFTRRK